MKELVCAIEFLGDVFGKDKFRQVNWEIKTDNSREGGLVAIPICLPRRGILSQKTEITWSRVKCLCFSKDPTVRGPILGIL